MTRFTFKSWKDVTDNQLAVFSERMKIKNKVTDLTFRGIVIPKYMMEDLDQGLNREANLTSGGALNLYNNLRGVEEEFKRTHS